MRRSEFEQLQDMDNADQLTDEQLARKNPFSGKREIKGAGFEGFKEAVDVVTDFLPVIGTAKAAAELPEDVSLIQDLMEEGYSEGDIKKLGLGGGLAIVTGLGFLPGVKVGADIAKRGIKEGIESAAEETVSQTRRAFGQDALITPQRRKQLEEAAQMPASERRRYLKEVNRPEPMVFHGAPSMLDDPAEDVFDAKHYQAKVDNIQDPLYEMLDKHPKGVRASTDEFVEATQFAGIKIPIMKDASGQYDDIPVRLRKRDDGGIDIVEYDDETMQDIGVLDTFGAKGIKSLDTIYPDPGRQLRQDLISRLELISERRSATPDFRSRKSRLREEGFEPYGKGDPGEGEFQGAYGMAGETSGEHHELKFKGLSTSLDPGVSMKPTFGGTNPEKVVYATVPRDKVRSLTPEEYDFMTRYGVRAEDAKAHAPLGERQIGYRLPKSLHLEDEIAVTKPEQLDVKSLTDDPYIVTRPTTLDAPSEEFVGPMKQVGKEQSLVGLVQEQQKVVEGLYDKINYMTEQIKPSAIKANEDTLGVLRGEVRKMPVRVKAYNEVRKMLSDMQGLGKYTRGEGTGDTYDNMFDNLFFNDASKPTDFYEVVKALEESLPEGSQRQQNMRGLMVIAGHMEDRDFLTATDTAKQAFRNVPDNVLYDVVFKGKITDDVTPEIARKIMQEPMGRADLKRLMFLATQNMNRGGLMTRK